MKRVLKIGGLILGALVAAFGLFLLYVVVAFPDAGEPLDLKVATDDAKLLERGRYLTEAVSVCTTCHSDRDYSAWGGPIIEATRGAGGQTWSEEQGLPATLHASNITPKGLEGYTDGTLAHAITSGITKSGRVMFPLMPYPMYRAMCREDLEAMVAYLRSLAPIDRTVPESSVNFPVSVFIRMAPKPYESPPCPDGKDEVALGRYLATIGACEGCHTPKGAGGPDTDWAYAGGDTFKEKGFTVRAANITPHPTTGIGNWDRQRFIDSFKRHLNTRVPVAGGEPNTVMPWAAYARMTERDLGAMFAYLKSLAPRERAVERFPKGE